MLKAAGRKSDFENIKKCVNILQKYPLSIELNIIFGLPGDSYEKFKRTLKQSLALKPQQISIYRLHVLPDSLLRSCVDELGLIYD